MRPKSRSAAGTDGRESTNRPGSLSKAAVTGAHNARTHGRTPLAESGLSGPGRRQPTSERAGAVWRAETRRAVVPGGGRAEVAAAAAPVAARRHVEQRA